MPVSGPGDIDNNSQWQAHNACQMKKAHFRGLHKASLFLRIDYTAMLYVEIEYLKKAKKPVTFSLDLRLNLRYKSLCCNLNEEFELAKSGCPCEDLSCSEMRDSLPF